MGIEENVLGKRGSGRDRPGWTGGCHGPALGAHSESMGLTSGRGHQSKRQTPGYCLGYLHSDRPDSLQTHCGAARQQPTSSLG